MKVVYQNPKQQVTKEFWFANVSLDTSCWKYLYWHLSLCLCNCLCMFRICLVTCLCVIVCLCAENSLSCACRCTLESSSHASAREKDLSYKDNIQLNLDPLTKAHFPLQTANVSIQCLSMSHVMDVKYFQKKWFPVQM